MMLIYTPMIFASGVFLVVQNILMSRTQSYTKSPATSAMVTQIAASATGIVGMLIVGTSFALFGDFFTTATWWYYLTGACGAAYMVVSIILATRLGIAACVIAPLIGQIVFSGFIDTLGLFGHDPMALKWNLALGILFVVLGGVLANMAKVGGSEAENASKNEDSPEARENSSVPSISPVARIILLAFGVAVGALVPIQANINGAILKDYGNSAFFSLVICCIFTFLFLAVITTFKREWSSFGLLAEGIKTRKLPLWLFTAGIFGGLFAAIQAFAVTEVMVSLVVVVTLLGQILFSILTDHLGWFGVTRRKVQPKQLIGVGLILAGIVCLNIIV